MTSKIGAPKRFDKFITLNMRNDDYKKLVEIAKENDITVSDIIRYAIKREIIERSIG